MNIEEIKVLSEAMKANGLTHLEYSKGDEKLVLERGNTNIPSAAGMIAEENAKFVNLDSAAVKMTDINISETVQAGEVVVSPMVGVFYSAPSPDSPPFVKVGDTVKKGDVLCIVEAMKLMNEIQSEFDGVVEEIYAKNEDIVEFNQPLVRIV